MDIDLDVLEIERASAKTRSNTQNNAYQYTASESQPCTHHGRLTAHCEISFWFGFPVLGFSHFMFCVPTAVRKKQTATTEHVIRLYRFHSCINFAFLSSVFNFLGGFRIRIQIVDAMLKSTVRLWRGLGIPSCSLRWPSIQSTRHQGDRKCGSTPRS